MAMTAQTCFTDEITVDGFCGGGGWSTGFELAIGRPVDIGINHDAAAIALHKKNHTSGWRVKRAWGRFQRSFRAVS